jgi:hypothetical protein
MAVSCENDSFQRGYVISQTADTLGETGIDEDASDLYDLEELSE